MKLSEVFTKIEIVEYVKIATFIANEVRNANNLKPNGGYSLEEISEMLDKVVENNFYIQVKVKFKDYFTQDEIKKFAVSILFEEMI